jgi:hypothetical protein
MTIVAQNNGSNGNGQCEDKVPGFCATRSKNGTQGIRSKNIDEFIPAVEQANIAWIDYVVTNIVLESSKVAAKLGFSESLVKRLLENSVDRSHPRGGYEDLRPRIDVTASSDSSSFSSRPTVTFLKK